MKYKTRTYSELISLPTFNERFEYLMLKGNVGMQTFGMDRYINQMFYKSKEWEEIRDYVIIRDNGCDLGIPGYEINNGVYINNKVLIHHMNPISMDDIVNKNPDILNPEYLITVSHTTHNAIHYGQEFIVSAPFVERRPNDTSPWKK